VLKSNLKAGKEGMLVAAKHGTFCKMEMVFESDERNLTTVEVTYPNDVVRFVVVHAPQEEAKHEVKEEFFESLMAEAERCLTEGHRLVLLGDFNARLQQITVKNSVTLEKMTKSDFCG
jgi:exonuclease III